MVERRKDSKNRVLKTGEIERKQGNYQYSWGTGKNRRFIYARSLKELREKEADISRDLNDGLRTDNINLTLNDMYNVWVDLKKGLKPNTLNNYKYMYDHFVKDSLGKFKLRNLRKTDIRRFYNELIDINGLKVNTLDTIHLVIHQILDLAVDDDLVRKNVSNHGLKELKKIRGLHSNKRKALTIKQQKLFLDYLIEIKNINTGIQYLV